MQKPVGKSINPTYLVKFLRGKAPYIKGDTAAFPHHVAEQYVNSGIAEWTTAPKKEEVVKRRARPQLNKQEVAEGGDGKGYITK